MSQQNRSLRGAAILFSCACAFRIGPVSSAAGETLNPAAASADSEGLTAVRPIERDTALVSNARPPALLLPADDAYGEAGALLSHGLAAAGIPAERVRDVAAADPAARTVICVGSMVNNPLIERLYWNRYTFVDALTPAGPAGPAGQYLLHTVYDPYPFNGGHNVIIIGCHDPEGAELGVKRFLSLARDGRLPYVVEAGPRPPVSEAEAARIAATKPDPTLTELAENSDRYLQTGCPAYARKAIAAMELMVKLYAPGGERNTRKDSFYTRLPWNEETNSWQIAGAWDAFEECPFLTDAQRLAFSNVILQFTRDLVGHVSGYAEIGSNDSISWNHATFPLLGIDFGARYFYRYYRLPDMAEMLAKARACFLAQARSWKPKEDADTYMSATMGHTLTYCLAENQMGYLAGGNMQRFADYIVGICDNLGQTSGFGDSNSMATMPRLADTVLPQALWWSRDGGYRWLMDRYTGGHWRNPYERGVAAVRPDRFVGINVFPLDRQVYDYTQTQPYYSEEVTRANVPAAEAFDKISFRENWEPAGQYLLVDGFARGKHLHYDGNSIVEFVEGGERWLIDHDYFTQNTTEHTMLSILRDGRCAELEPSMSGLAREADLPGCGYTRTYVRDYNGCDWQRQILWRKGGWFLVVDTVSPAADGDYAFDLTWKTMDSGSERIDERDNFVTERGVSPEKTRHCSVIEASPSAGPALRMEDIGAQIAFGVDLPAGEYSLTVVGGSGDVASDRSNCLRITVDGGASQWFCLTGGSASPPAKGGPPLPKAPRIVLAGRRPHVLLAATSNIHATLVVERFIFEDAAGEKHVYEAANLPPVPNPQAELARRMWIKPAEAVNSWISNHHPAGIPVPVSILHQRQEGEFRAGQKIRFASLVFTSRPEARRDLQPVRIGGNLLAVQGGDPGLALLGAVDDSGLTATVEAGLLTPRSLALCALRQFRAGELSIASSVPVDLELDLASGKASVRAPAAGAEVEFSLAGRRQAFRVPAGLGEITLTGYESPTQGIGLIGALIRTPPPAAKAAGPSLAGANPPAWTALSPGGEIACMKSADLGDGKGTRLFVCRDNTLQCLSADGERLWNFTLAGRARDVAFGKLRPGPTREILVCSPDTFVYLLSADGRLLEKRQMHGEPWNRSFGDDPYGVHRVGVWDLKGDGSNEIVVAVGNADVQAFDAGWRPLWRSKDSANDGAMQLSFEDLDGGGRPETILLADKYGYCVGIDTDGKEVYRGRNSIGDAAYTVASVDGGKARRIVTASSGGDLMATSTRGWWGAAGGIDTSDLTLAPHQVLWRFDNYGYPVNRLCAADLNGEGKDEVLIAGGGGYLYALDTDGRLLWQDHAGRCVNDVLAFAGPDGMRVAYCDESGPVRIADGHGRLVREMRPPSPARLLKVVPAAGGPLLVMALADGRVAAYGLR